MHACVCDNSNHLCVWWLLCVCVQSPLRLSMSYEGCVDRRMHVCDMTQIVCVRDDSILMCVWAESSQTEHELWWVCRQTHAHGEWCNTRSGSHHTARATSCRPSFCGYVGVYIYIYIYTYVCMYINISIYIYTPHANWPKQLRAGRLFVGMWVYIYICTYTYILMYVYI